MKLTSKQFLILKPNLIRISIIVDRTEVINIPSQLEETATSFFYVKKDYIPNYRSGQKYKKLYDFYFSSEFDVNFFKIKYPEVIIYE